MRQTSIIDRVIFLVSYKRLALGLQKAIDIVLLIAAFSFAYALRFDFSLSADNKRDLLQQVFIVVAIQFTFLHLAGIYHFIWRYVSIAETLKIIYCLAAASFLFLLGRTFLAGSNIPLSIPFSIIIMDFVLSVAVLVGIRATRRIFYESDKKRKNLPLTEKPKNVILIGAGRAGVRTIQEIKLQNSSNLRVKGIVDDDDLKQKAIINGVKVIGKISDLSQLVEKLSIDHVILTIAQTSRGNIRRILDICKEIPVKVRTIPSYNELIQGTVNISHVRDLKIEDLLGREAVELDKESINNYISNKVIAVSGAGGSIGSELVRQIASCKPESILLIERAEFALFKIEQEIKRVFPDIKIVPLTIDIIDEFKLERVFKHYCPKVVFHAAAHKHVPLMEDNPTEAVSNNILGTYHLGEVAGRCGVESFVLISSDKAVNSTSVMGATKRVAELVTLSLDKKYNTRYISVRFGNVIGSTGSVIPIFQEQIKNGGPVTVTHPEMTRYFMTIPEATQLVLQAGTIGKGGEIFVLDMGEPIKISDLARDVIRLSGLEPETDIKIVFTGIRPGEKLFEELQGKTENLTKTRHPKIFIGQNKSVIKEGIWEILQHLKFLCKICDYGESNRQIKAYLNKILPEAKLTTVNKEMNCCHEPPVLHKYTNIKEVKVANSNF